MLKTIIIYNSNCSGTSKENALLFKKILLNYGEVQLVDMSIPRPLHEYFFEIQRQQANLHITMDLAGFELKTEGDKPSYNIIPGRFFHFIRKPKDNYPELLDVENNLAHFIYVLNEADNDISYTNIIENLLKEAELLI